MEDLELEVRHVAEATAIVAREYPAAPAAKSVASAAPSDTADGGVPVSTLHGLVLAIAGSWHQDASQNKLMLSVPRRKRAWFAGL